LCPTCSWNFHSLPNSDEEKWAQNQWQKSQEQEDELEKFKREYQKLREEKEKLNSKFENLYKQLVEKAEERERLLLSLLQPISSIPSKIDELVDAIKIPLKNLSGQYTVDNQIKKETIEHRDKRQDNYSQNTATKLTVKNLSEIGSESHITRQPLLLNQEETELAKLYNEKHKKFVESVIKVSLTQDSLEKDRLGKTIKLFFQKNHKGTYWIFIADKQKYFLFPEHHFKLNEFNYQALETSFTCYGNWQNEGSALKILKPGIVRPLDQGGEKWEFVDKGVIEFTSI
jgi:hypothetical protein